MSLRFTGVLIGSLLLVAPLASADGIPLRDWTVPSPSSGLTALGDISNPGVFVAVTPCRVADTRNAAGAWGGPELVANASRSFDIDGGPCTGIPPGASAFSLNFTMSISRTLGPRFFTIIPPRGHAGVRV